MDPVWILLSALLLSTLLAFVLWRALRPPAPHSPLSETSHETCAHALVPESRYIEVDGLKVHFTQSGSGSDIVLLHGIGASVYVWRFLFPLLQTRMRVTAIDLPGFGKSTKDAGRDHGLDAQCEIVAKSVQAIGITNATLVGSSMGGAIAFWLARKYPERFPQVIGIGPATDSRLVPALTDSLGSMTPLFWRAINRHSMRLILTRVLRRGELITDECVDAYLEPFRDGADSLKTFWAALALLSDKRLPDHLSDLKVKVLVLYGERDFMVPRTSIDRLLKLLPHAGFASHADGGHHVMEDEPIWTAERILAFVEAETRTATEG